MIAAELYHRLQVLLKLIGIRRSNIFQKIPVLSLKDAV